MRRSGPSRSPRPLVAEDPEVVARLEEQAVVGVLVQAVVAEGRVRDARVGPDAAAVVVDVVGVDDEAIDEQDLRAGRLDADVEVLGGVVVDVVATQDPVGAAGAADADTAGAADVIVEDPMAVAALDRDVAAMGVGQDVVADRRVVDLAGPVAADLEAAALRPRRGVSHPEAIHGDA
jgi:hypothetical protein